MKWQGYWKGILTFVGSFVTNAIVTWSVGGQPWPTTSAEWLQWLVTILGTTGVVIGGPANKQAKASA